MGLEQGLSNPPSAVPPLAEPAATIRCARPLLSSFLGSPNRELGYRPSPLLRHRSSRSRIALDADRHLSHDLVIPLLMIATGFDGIFDGEPAGLFWLVSAAIVAVVGRTRLNRAQGFTLHRVTSGKLRNRAFAIARRTGIKLREVCIVPAGRGHLTNAFATTWGGISLTDNLPKYMTKQEVDSCIAHELAHLKCAHLRKHLLVLVLTFSAMVALLFRLPPHIAPFRPLLDLGVILVPLSIYYFFSRRYEYAADREGLRMMGDPEVAIRSLAKLYRVVQVPPQWSRFSELFLTHPSLTRRAQAIARSAQIPPARALEILRETNLTESKINDAPSR